MNSNFRAKNYQSSLKKNYIGVSLDTPLIGKIENGSKSEQKL